MARKQQKDYKAKYRNANSAALVNRNSRTLLNANRGCWVYSRFQTVIVGIKFEHYVRMGFGRSPVQVFDRQRDCSVIFIILSRSRRKAEIELN
jgi:hypothetical protein